MSRIFQHSGEGRFIKSHVIKLRYVNLAWGFPGGGSGKKSACQWKRCRRHGFDPWVGGHGKIPWRRAWQLTLVFLPGESHGQRSLVGYSPRVSKSWTPLKWLSPLRPAPFDYPHFQFSSVSQSCPTLRDPMNHSMPGLPVHHQLLEYTQTHVHWVSDAIQPSHPLSSPSPPLPPIPPSIRVFSNESTLRMRWPKYWSFSFSIICSKEIPGLISFRMDWLDLLAVQGTLKSLLQHHSSTYPKTRLWFSLQ